MTQDEQIKALTIDLQGAKARLEQAARTEAFLRDQNGKQADAIARGPWFDAAPPLPPPGVTFKERDALVAQLEGLRVTMRARARESMALIATLHEQEDELDALRAARESQDSTITRLMEERDQLLARLLAAAYEQERTVRIMERQSDEVERLNRTNRREAPTKEA